jgi:flagellar biosynthesis protein FlhG
LSDVGKLPIEPFGSGEIVIYLDKNPESIKVAYSMIKIMCNQLGTRNFGILMFDMNQSTAKTVFRNLSHVARNNLHVELELVGYLGVETQLGLVSQFGDGAMDNFPIVSDTVKREANLVNNETRNSNFVSSLSGMNHSRLLEA